MPWTRCRMSQPSSLPALYTWSEKPWNCLRFPHLHCSQSAVSMNGERLRVRSLTFDVGGTLIRPWPSVGHVYASAAQRYGYSNINPEILNRQFTAACAGDVGSLAGRGGRGDISKKK